MKKKICILLVSIFLISGCSVEYNLIINDDNKIKETVSILEKNGLIGSSLDEINEQLDWSLIFASDETEYGYFYRKEKIVNSDKSGVKYSYDFTTDNFPVESEALKACYENYNLKIDGDILEISASDFKCSLTLGNNYDLTVNITTTGEPIDGNFHKKSNNTYTWNFDETNSNYIFLRVNRANMNDSNNQYIWVFIVIAVLALSASLIFLTAYIKNKNSNKMSWR